MAAKGQKKNSKDDPNSRVVCTNRRARHEYEILDQLDCGVVLLGSEVKSIRNNKITIEEAYARVENGEVWLLNADIAEYPQATMFNHERRRDRKLLLNKREVRKFAEPAGHDGLTLVPLSVFFANGLVKVRLGLCRGRKLHDKRQKMKDLADRRDMQAAQRR
ncbi:MAG: SsrA-binding protein SmpB [Planctomycetaceae bacterium]|nr:SsrA-binding protein SmpB [Planctomycetaceae bacterium]